MLVIQIGSTYDLKCTTIKTMYESMSIHCLFFTSFFFPTCLNQENQPSTKPQGRKRARSKTTVPTTTRTTRASASRLNQTDHTSPNDDTSAHRTSKDSNSPQADTEMQHSQDMTNSLRQIDNSDTLRGQGICIVIS
jgi:hypothetical protein